MTSDALPGNSFKAIERVSPTQQVRAQLLAAIESGEYPPGAPLPSERVLRETFGVSRVSVREALAGLEAMKLIVIHHGRGAFVREGTDAGPFTKYIELHREELVELARVRGALDELAAEDVARSGTAESLAAITEAATAFADAAERGDLGEATTRDLAFHLTIADSSNGKLLPRLIHELNEALADSRVATFAQAGQLEASIREHRAITDALEAHDPAAARRAVHRHMARITKWLENSAGQPS
ncbi:FadR/GntR family transcriptional regulator [Amycolatopsis jejuensis]|uniref:FadR/GntR family transcriptional regulator n=1 Tax=Amycolatopsis jejuensis TaxID=330084 RepID=UPI000526B312|nr:FadR/GntR family transcriptional regulator [Amycolatopsis jejuensis]